MTLNVYDHGRGQVHPGSLPGVLGAVDHVGNVGEANRGTILRSDDDVLIFVAAEKLIVGVDGVRLPLPIQNAFCLIDIGLPQNCAQIFQAEAIGSQRGGVCLNAYGGLLSSADRNEADAGQLRDLLRESRVGEVFDLGERQSVGSQSEGENRSIGRIDLAIDRRIGKIPWKVGCSRIDGGLYLLLANIDILIQIELQNDERASKRTGRGHLTQTRNLAELTLQGSCYGGRHHLGIGAWIKSNNLNRGVIDFRQC